MAEARVQRRLAAITAADVVGYSPYSRLPMAVPDSVLSKAPSSRVSRNLSNMSYLFKR